MIPQSPGRKGGAPQGAPPPIYLGVRQTHKGGERPRDCQDAWWVGAHPPRVAVADGATRAFFPREWAWMLAEHFCQSEGLAADLLRADESDAWRAALAPVRGEWRDAVQTAIQLSPMREMLENRLWRKDPAVATLVGVELAHQGGGWRAVIIGDSCLLRFGHAGEFLASHPFDQPAQFDNHPEALISVADPARETAPRVTSGTEEVLVLATDATAKWLLSIQPSGRFRAVLYLLGDDEAGFDARVRAARRGDGECQGVPAMEDDDVTLMVVSLGKRLAGTCPLGEVAAGPPPAFSHQQLGPEPAAGAPGSGEEPDEPAAAPMSPMFSPPAAPARPPIQTAPGPPADVPAPVTGGAAGMFAPSHETADVPPSIPGDAAGKFAPSEGTEDAPAPGTEPAGDAQAGGEAGNATPLPALPDDFLVASDASVAPAGVRAADAGADPEADPAVEVPAAARVPDEVAVRDVADADQGLAGVHESLLHGEGDPAPAPGVDAAASTPTPDDGTPPDAGGDGTLATDAGKQAFEDHTGDDSRADGPLLMRKKASGFIDRIARVEKRRLAVLTLAGWFLFLLTATATAAAALWPRGSAGADEPAPDTTGRTTPPVIPAAAVPAPLHTILPADTRILSSPADGSPLRIVLRGPVPAVLRRDPASGWWAVEIDGWVARHDGGNVLAALEGSVVRTEQPVNVRADSTKDGTVLGVVQKEDSFPFRGRAGNDDTHERLPIRISGFIRDTP